MQHETDDQVAVPLVADLTARFPTLNSVSFDKGFHSPANQQRLLEMIELPVLPKKGKCSPTEYARTPSGFPIPAPAPPRYRVGHQCAGGARPGPLPRSWHRRLQALRRAGCARAQPARLGAILIAQDAEQEQCQRKRAA
jgi:hypothetical protein